MDVADAERFAKPATASGLHRGPSSTAGPSSRAGQFLPRYRQPSRPAQNAILRSLPRVRQSAVRNPETSFSYFPILGAFGSAYSNRGHARSNRPNLSITIINSLSPELGIEAAPHVPGRDRAPRLPIRRNFAGLASRHRLAAEVVEADRTNQAQ